MLIDVDQENNLSFDFNEPDIGTNTLGCGQLLDSELLTTDGIVSEIYTTTDYGFHHQATNNVQGGFSGGGIFNADNGKCIGIITQKTLVGCAFVPSGEILKWLQDNEINWLVDNSEPLDNVLTLELD